MRKLLPALALALAASLALSALGVASASAAAPANTALPVVTASPYIGSVASTTNGTWSGSPTSYAYVWFRCNASGVECKSIPGATKSTYTPVAADGGKTLLTSVTASNAEGSGVALSKPSGVVPVALEPGQWHSCKNVGEGKGVYEDSACSTEGGSKAFAWNRLTSTPTAFAMKGTSSFTLKWKWSGTPFAAVCTTQKSEGGTIQNPLEGYGTLSGAPFVLSGCTMSEPAEQGCKVKGAAITMPSIKGTITEFEGKYAVKFEPTSGTQLFEMTLEGCKTGAFNVGYKFTGTFTGIANNATSSLEFSSASSAISFGGVSTTLEGTSRMETKAGEALKIAP